MQRDPSSMLELYSDYLISNISYSTATGLARMLPDELNHDQVTRFLNRNEFDSKYLWKKIKPTIRTYENDDGVLSFDDCIAEKAYTDENDIICWHWDHSKGRAVKGLNLLTGFISYDINSNEEKSGRINLPLSYDIVEKTVEFCDVETQKVRRRSIQTKNDRLKSLLEQIRRNEVKYKYILMDSWFASKTNLNFIVNDIQKHFIVGIKSNRLVSLIPDTVTRKDLKRIDELELKEEQPMKVYLKGVIFPVNLMKKTFKNEGGSEGILYLVTSDLSLDSDQILETYKKRWKIEEYHRSIKNNTSLTRSPTKRERSQLNHLFCSLYSFVKLEILSVKKRICQTSIRMKLILKAQQAALQELQLLRENMESA